jgi:hypothetical protein
MPTELALRRTGLTATQRRSVPLYRWKLAYFPAKLDAAVTRSVNRRKPTLRSCRTGLTVTVAVVLVTVLSFAVYVVFIKGFAVVV